MSERRRRLWLSRISRADLTPSSYPYVRVCSDHFESGKPAPLYREADLDWGPSVNLGHQKVLATPTLTRGKRLKERKGRIKCVEAAKSLISLFDARESELCEEACVGVDSTSSTSASDSDVTESETDIGKCTQTDLTSDVIGAMNSELNRLTVENIQLREKLASVTISEDTFKDDDEKVKLFTGLPAFSVLMTLFSFIESAIPQGKQSFLSKFQKLVMVLMRLKLNLPVSYLAEKFRLSSGSISRIFLSTLHVLHCKLHPLIYWPTQDERRLTMPMGFRKHFGLKVAIIIDCFELFIERPSNLEARAQTWSSYKHHNTVKFLIGISPQGVISFISKGYGGRSYDKHIIETVNC
ncbi:uncharacterized protein LOC134233943 [Saccostrea cucullata]|uniref:uncharacterized protein LOC134233943 n=1 Tax=Saccostrea cuccullata TaxID=36930 RepID=UPI002ED06486